MDAFTGLLVAVCVILIGVCIALGAALASSRQTAQDAQVSASKAQAARAASLAQAQAQARAGRQVGATFYGTDDTVLALADSVQAVMAIVQRAGCRVGRAQLDAAQALVMQQLAAQPSATLRCADASAMGPAFADMATQAVVDVLAGSGMASGLTGTDRAQLTQALLQVWSAAVAGACAPVGGASAKLTAQGVRAFFAAISGSLCPDTA